MMQFAILKTDLGSFGILVNKSSLLKVILPNKVKSKKILASSKKWKLLLGKTKLKPHKKHLFKSKASNKNKVNCLRINIFPDGGISRIRAFGKVVK